MKALEFESVLTPEHTLIVPIAVAAQLPQGKPLRVLLLLKDEPPPPPPPQWKDQADEPLQPGDLGSDTLYDELAGP
jgi:hypothetical protein